MVPVFPEMNKLARGKKAGEGIEPAGGGMWIEKIKPRAAPSDRDEEATRPLFTHIRGYKCQGAEGMLQFTTCRVYCAYWQLTHS